MASQVSVIIPCHNAAEYIVETVESALGQTLAPAEIVVIDDGSTDQSIERLARFGDRIRVLHKPNGGPASARNLGIISSSGEYVAFLDSDDIWMAGKLERQVAELDRNPGVALLFSEATMFRDESGVRRELQRIGYTADPTFRQLLFGDFIPNSTVIMRRSCVERVGLLNEKRELVGVEDYEYWMRVAHDFEMRGLAEPLAGYRIRNGNLMGDGRDIEKGHSLARAAIAEVEALFPAMWSETGVDRGRLFARLHLRAGFAWRKARNWRGCLDHYLAALGESRHPLVLRWMIAASLLKRWS